MASLTAGMWFKMTLAIGGVGIAIPTLLWKALPSDVELTKRYPDDQQPHLVRDREQNAVAMEEYIAKIREYSKDKRNVWIVMKEEQERARKAYAKQDAQKQRVEADELAARRAEIQKDIMSGSN